MRPLCLALVLSACLSAQAPPTRDQQPAAPQQKAPQASKPELPRPFKLTPEMAMKLFEQQKAQKHDRAAVPQAGNKLTLKPGQKCAVPLKNVLPAGMDPDPAMVKAPPPTPGAGLPMKEASPPAPSCDDVK